MGVRYVVFDVETPNACNNRMSALGVSVVEDGVIVQDFATLVNPECSFDDFNVQLTGITPEAAERAPTFAQLWPQLVPLFESGLLIAHNAPFDMGVLGKCLRAYCIDWEDRVDYACTVRMGRKCYPELENHRLNTLCAYRGIPLEHHQAASDSHACALLLLDYLRSGLEVEPFRRSFDMRTLRTLPPVRRSRTYKGV